MVKSVTYQKVLWTGTELSVESEREIHLDKRGDKVLSVRVDMQGMGYSSPTGNFMADITKFSGGTIDNLSIVEHASYEDRDEIDISDYGLKSFSLSNAIGRHRCASVRLDNPIDTLHYFSLKQEYITKSLLKTVSACPNLLGLSIDSAYPCRDWSIPIPCNKSIVYWMFDMGPVKVPKWSPKKLEILRLENAHLKKLPNFVVNPPDTLDEVYLAGNDLDNHEIKSLDVVLSGETNKTVSLCRNPNIIDIPVWENMNLEDCRYYAHNTFFTTPEVTQTPRPLLYENSSTFYNIETELLEGGSEFVEAAYNNRVRNAQDPEFSHYKDIYLYGNDLISHDYRRLLGYSKHEYLRRQQVVRIDKRPI